MPDELKYLLISSKGKIALPSSGEPVLSGIFLKEKEGEKTLNKDDAHRIKRKFYSVFLQNHFENLVALAGAGTSVGYGGLTMNELWDKTEKELTTPVFLAFCKAVKFLDKDATTLPETAEGKNLESLLSKANIAKEFVDPAQLDISKLIEKCEDLIQESCTILDDPSNPSPHGEFLNKITNRKLKDPRVKLFTSNYDTLFEQAAISGGFTVIDGFSFSTPRTLSGRNFDYDIVYREKSRIREEESFVPKVFHFYKLHGSVNWERKENEQKKSEVLINEKPEKALMIFPRDSKYENSYDQPFFEMMSRFHEHLRKNNVLLICLGFSFNDKHMVTAIKEAVMHNPSFRLLIVNRTIRYNSDTIKWFIDMAERQHNITIISEEFSDFARNYPSSKIYSNESSNIIPSGNESEE